MRLKAFISLLLVACLMASTATLMGRNTPYPKSDADPISHPWQDDNQWVGDNPTPSPITFPVGPIIVTLDIPSKWFRGLVSKGSDAKPKPQSTYRTAKPMSLNQKGMDK